MKRALFMLVVLLGALHVAPLSSVLACTPTPAGIAPYTLADQVNAAPIILVGTVIAVDDATWYAQTATVSVQQYLKGSGPAQVGISNFGSSSMCLTTVSVGDSWIFFAGGDSNTGLSAFYMSAGAAIKSASVENITAIQAIVQPTSGGQTRGNLFTSLLQTVGAIGTVLVGLILR